MDCHDLMLEAAQGVAKPCRSLPLLLSMGCYTAVPQCPTEWLGMSAMPFSRAFSCAASVSSTSGYPPNGTP